MRDRRPRRKQKTTGPHTVRPIDAPVGDWITRLNGKITVNGSGCWIFGTDPDTYPLFYVAGKQRRLHRVVYELLVGPIADGHHLHHECETPACINPEHLRQLTPGEHSSLHNALRRAS